jgi:hypothetical protein
VKKSQLRAGSERKPRLQFGSIITASTSDTITEEKIENVTQGLPSQYLSLLLRMLPANKENVLDICEYVSSLKSEVNVSDHYRKDMMLLLYKFSTYFNNTKSFEISREDLLSFLDSFRKAETVDPLHKWIGTYNTYRTHLLRFFKWLYSPNVEPDKRSKPEVVQNTPQLKRKEKSIYKPTDLSTQDDDSLFLRYCPNPRDRCYHAISRPRIVRRTCSL